MHWCLGMYASGSTWVYNVTREIAAFSRPPKPVQGHFVSRFQDIAALGYADQVHIVKSHDIDDEGAVEVLSKRAVAIIVSIRDPRDAVTSLMLYHKRAFDEALSLVEKSARLCSRFVGDSRALLLRYEAGFIDDVSTLDRIADTFRHRLEPAQRAQIFASSRRSAIESFIAELPRRSTSLVNVDDRDHFLDPDTHWNTHHAGRTGEIGRWRQMLTEDQCSKIGDRLGTFMERFAYACD